MNNRGLISLGVLAAGAYVAYRLLDIETKDRIMNSIRNYTDTLPENVRAVIPSFFLSVPGVLDKEVYNATETLARVKV